MPYNPAMHSAQAYLPSDRRRAAVTGIPLPEFDRGAILFADISGFTHLTNLLVERLGPRRGAEAATHHLNTVYGALVHTIHACGGSVVSFSGDGMLCWFAAAPDLAEAARRALHAAVGLHIHMVELQTLPDTAGATVELGLKVALAAGSIHRRVVGDPAVQLFDVVAGSPVDEVAVAEALAKRGETLAAARFADLLAPEARMGGGRRMDAEGRVYFLLRHETTSFANTLVDAAPSAPADDDVKSWIFPAVFARLASGQERFLAELRPGVALFIRITGLDLSGDSKAAGLLDGYVRWVQQVLARDDALLVQVTTGDKGTYLYGAFGAIVLHDDDALRAVFAALALRQPPAELAAIGPVQIGLAQGRMRVGPYGSDERRTFGVQGAAVNLAARLMMAAPPGSVVIEQELADRLDGRYMLADMGSVALKGMAEALHLYQVVGVEQAGERRPGGGLPFVGRDTELRAVLACASDVKIGQGRIVRIEGDPGIGKSTLLQSVQVELIQAGWRVALAEAQSTRRHLPYSGVHSLLWQLLPLSRPQAGDEQAVVAALRAWLGQLDATWDARLPLLRDVLALPLADSPLTAGLEPETRRQAVLAFVMDIVARVAADAPTALLVDDAEWLDEAGASLLSAMANALPALPVLLVLAQRGSDLLPGMDDPGAVVCVHLGELAREPLAKLAAQHLAAPLDEVAEQAVNAVAQGNPLVLSQVLDTLTAAGRLVRQKAQIVLSPDTLDALRASRALVSSESGWTFVEAGLDIGSVLGLPDSLHGLILARVDRLPEATKLTLKVASVVGRVFDPQIVARAHPLGPDSKRVAADLETLRLQGLLARTEAEPGAGYRFEHNLTQEIVYQTLLSTQQQELHGRVAGALETLQPDAVLLLAHHFAAADTAQPDVRAKAAHYLDGAVDRLRAEYANETALRFLERALSLADRWQWRKERVELLHLLGRRQDEQAALADLAACKEAPQVEQALLTSRYYEAVNDYVRAQDAAARAHEDALAAGNRAAQAACLVQLARVAGREGDYSREGDSYRRALDALGEDAQDQAIGIEIFYGLGIVAQQSGDYERAEGYLHKALDLARLHTNPVDEARILTALGIVARLARHFEKAYAWTERSLAIRRLVGDRAGESASLMSLAQVVIHGMGDYGRGRDLLEDALVMARRLQDRWSQGIVLNELGIVYLLVGAWEMAARYLLDALAICEEIGAEAGAAHVLCNLGQVQRGQGRLDAAAASFERGYATVEEIQDPHLQAQYWSEMAQLALEQGDAVRAQRLAGQAVAALRALDLEVMATADLCTLAEAGRALGQEEAAVEAARAAYELLQACGGEGPDYPQRDYYRSARILAGVDQASAEAGFAAARRILETRAQRIGDDTLRTLFLTSIPLHAAMMQAAENPSTA